MKTLAAIKLVKLALILRRTNIMNSPWGFFKKADIVADPDTTVKSMSGVINVMEPVVTCPTHMIVINGS